MLDSRRNIALACALSALAAYVAASASCISAACSFPS
jgi:hypothetical protein